MEGAASRMAASYKDLSLHWTRGGTAKVAKMCFSSEDDAPTDTDFWLSIRRGTSSQGPLEFSPQDILDYWMVSLERNQRQMLAVMMTEHFKHTLNLSVKQAATGVSGGLQRETVHRYGNNFFENEGHFIYSAAAGQVRATLCATR